MTRIAIIGSGIAGLTAGYLLGQKYNVTLFEANDYVGGHTHTHQVQEANDTLAIDTGFIVFNKKTYPLFLKLLNEIKIDYLASDMSFSVYSAAENYYYSGRSLNGIFAQRRNIFKWRHWRLLHQIMHFNRACLKLYDSGNVPDITLGDYLQQHKSSRELQDYYLLPMVSAIWSSGIVDAKVMPLKFFLRFFANHCLFNVVRRPQWYVIKDGSQRYIPPLLSRVHQVNTEHKIISITRHNDLWQLINEDKAQLSFDKVVFACHADDARAILGDLATPAVTSLEKFAYNHNKVTLHHDNRLLPPKSRAYAAWNYLLSPNSKRAPTLTYYSNQLQSLTAEQDYCVSVNPSVAIAEDKVIKHLEYRHPIYTNETLIGQERIQAINGEHGLFFCGAHMGNGFHEDGVRSAVNVAHLLGVDW